MTEPLQPTGSASATTQVLLVEEPPRRKRRWLGWVIGLFIVVALLAVAAIVGETLARQYAEGYIRDRVIEALPVDPATPLDVEVGGGPVLLQAISGRMTEIVVGIPELTIGEISGSATVTASGVPLDESQPTENLDIVLTIPASSVQRLSTYLSGIELDSITLGNGLITVDTTVDLLLFSVPISIDLAPSADAGGIAFRPETITLEQQEISVDDLRSNPLVSGIAGSLLRSQVFCVAESLPKALTLSEVSVVGSDLVVRVTGDGVALGDPALLETGTCP
ncbi:hypothetical protein HDC94_001488 [Leifsonia sp. AK011]|uniref:LmeA family phospholipid-binding protein n=1 Tax=Leifsonia sp. AK011 TaxID=2723075 RepID=UPI0015CD90EF|nr:LmeA family phospholipid-binding protein [Leifsonia sp. AK011]NYF10332.1 hypothetical protein [Leifsonia sp. AK011]